MRQVYRGHTIDVRRMKCLGGWDRLYFTVVRESDGYVAVEDGTDGSDTVRDYMRYMRERIDRELASDDPWDERWESEGRP